jgi:diguanylate cyclase (GGDEF)-like protein
MPALNHVVHSGVRLLFLAGLALLGWAVRTGDFQPATVADVTRVVAGVIGLAGAVAAARAPGTAPGNRRAWRLVAVSFLVMIAAPLLPPLFDGGDEIAEDVTHVAFVVVLLLAMLQFPLARQAVLERRKATLDGLTVLLGGSMVVFYVAVGPYVQRYGLTPAGLVTVGLYPLADLALLAGVTRVLLRGEDGSRVPMRALAGGAIILFAGDVVHGYLHAHGRPEAHSGWQYLLWMTADSLLAIAALEQWRPDGIAPRAGLRSVPRLPYLGAAVAPALMLVAAVRQAEFFPWGGLSLGGALLTGLVLARQALVQRESDEHAVTDGLTGLANRERFEASSRRALARGVRTGRHTAVLVLDMNGFKEINDSLGHHCGDVVLVAFAGLLRRCVPPGGLAARLGGDEFAVVLPDLVTREEAYAVAGRIAAEVTPVVAGGRLVPMEASIGVAVSGPDELAHEEIVHRADVAMYRAKEQAPRTRWTAWRESYEPEPEPVPAAA